MTRETRALIERASPILREAAKKTSLLGAIAWPVEVEERFFAAKAARLPDPKYEIDRATIEARLETLRELERSIAVNDEITGWLARTTHSFIDGNRLLLALGTREFHLISKELYGGASTASWEEGTKNIVLAEHILSRLEAQGWDETTDVQGDPWSDERFAEALRKRVSERVPRMEIEVIVDARCTAKIQAGRTRVRIRKGAEFYPWELDNLWSHEVETHSLCAQNGIVQPLAPFLSAGGPRSTRTQEGLATFAELYDHDLGINRMRQLAHRVKLVAMAESGADFLELYRYALDRGSTEREAYLDAQRVCRGGLVGGGAPFTKDVCYLAGLLDVYTFLAYVVRAGNRDEAEMLVCGRVALEDMPALVELRHLHLLERPRYLPAWLANWRGLLPYFAFTSFVGSLDLGPVESKFARVLELARRASGEAGVANPAPRDRAPPSETYDE
ncbi:MAG: DUF1704 domain-containing protein [Deltaproteobacteria bacterium]|nr:DUF1704 domain-containing protein [Deltaproteobacteria bacterium]